MDIQLFEDKSIYEKLAKCIEESHVRRFYKTDKSAEELLREWIKGAENNDPQSCSDLGSMLNKIGEDEYAIEFLRAAVNGGNFRSQYELAWLLEKTGRLEEAEKLYLDIIDSGDTAVYFDLASMYEDQGRLEEAEKIYREFAEGGSGAGLLCLSDVLEQMGRTEEARYYYELLENMDNDDDY